MARPPFAMLITLTLAGCDLSALLGDGPTRNCDVREAFWPDEDGDGVGDAGSTVYIGCEAPDGYVSVPPPGDTDVGQGDSDSADTGPTDALPPADSGLTDSALPHDTDEGGEDSDDSDASPTGGS